MLRSIRFKRVPSRLKLKCLLSLGAPRWITAPAPFLARYRSNPKDPFCVGGLDLGDADLPAVCETLSAPRAASRLETGAGRDKSPFCWVAFFSQLSSQQTASAATEGPFVAGGRRRVVSVLWFSQPSLPVGQSAEKQMLLPASSSLPAPPPSTPAASA